MRSYSILKALANTKSYLPINFFMEELSVSKRTVQNELTYSNKVSKKNGYTIHNTYGKGYLLEISDNTTFNQFLNTLMTDSEMPNEEQLILDVLGNLLVSKNSYVTVNELSELLGLSDTFLYTKMKTVSNYLETYSLELNRKSHYGVSIDGNKKDIRKLMADLYLKGNNSFKEYTDTITGAFERYEKLAEECIRNNGLRMGYYEFQQIIVWLKVLVMFNETQSNKNENNVILSERDLNTSELKQKLNILLLSLQKEFGIIINQDIITEFENLVERSTQKADHSENKFNKEKLKMEIIHFFKSIDVESHNDYGDDHEFLDQLTTHLSFLLDRLDKKITYKNPLLLEVCIRNPLVFDTVLKFSVFLQNKFRLEISNDELGFIAIHFLNHVEKQKSKRINQYEQIAVICTTGGGVSNLIRTQILGIFPNSNVRTFSFWEESGFESFNPDLIFSVVPLRQEPKVPIIYINELLSRRDISNIKQVLFLEDVPQREDTRFDANSNDYLSLMKSLLFSVELDMDYQELIKKMSMKMIEQEYADVNFQDNVVQREKYMSTIYKNGIAMPHPIEMDGKKSAIAVSILKSSNKKKTDVKIAFMVCLTKEDFKYYSSISNGLFQLMQNEYKISEIYNDPKLQTVINSLRELEE